MEKTRYGTLSWPSARMNVFTGSKSTTNDANADYYPHYSAT